MSAKNALEYGLRPARVLLALRYAIAELPLAWAPAATADRVVALTDTGRDVLDEADAIAGQCIDEKIEALRMTAT